VRVNGLRQAFCEKRFRFESAMTSLCLRSDLLYDSGVASHLTFPLVTPCFPAACPEGNRKPVDPREQQGNSGVVSTQQDHDQA
jgi:hypothetical protein